MLARRTLVGAALLLLVAAPLLAQTMTEPHQSTSGPEPPPGVAPKVRGTPPPSPRSVMISGVPGYYWRHGCGPTALGMIIGYYDTHGFDDLIPGDASTQTEEVDQAIASERDAGDPGHFEDYSEPIDDSDTGILPDRSEPPAGDEHEHDSIADFAETSWSLNGSYYGWGYSNRLGDAFLSWVEHRNPDYVPSAHQYRWYDGTLTWEVLTHEIDQDRPMLFLVDSDGDGGTDHFVTIIGYTEEPTQQYACLDTWWPPDEPRWCEFEGMGAGQDWGIYDGWSLRPMAILEVDAGGGAEYTTIGDALADAPDEAWVRVRPGTYTGPGNRDLDPGGKDLWVFSTAGPESTIIDCEGLGRGFYFGSQETEDCIVEGFTIRNGSSDRGGGIRCFFNSSPTLEDLVIQDCHATLLGGGMQIASGSSPSLTRITLVGNTTDGSGGALHVLSAAPDIAYTTICSNGAATQASGIHVAGVSAPTIANTIIAHGTGAGAIFCDPSATPSITHSCVYGNAEDDSLCGDFFENLFLDPLFCDVGEPNLELQDASPCLPYNNEWNERIGAHGAGGCGTDIEDGGRTAVALHPPTPNPFRATTAIVFELPESASVDVTVYDVRGRLVRSLLANEARSPGRHIARWDGRDDRGHGVASGVYFVRLEVAGWVATRRAVLLK